jgi:hypothetical protein
MHQHLSTKEVYFIIGVEVEAQFAISMNGR